MSNKAVFLDSDGVLNEAVLSEDGKPLAPTSLEQFHIYPYTKTALAKLKAAGFKLFCVTNKPDVIEGRMTKKDLDAIFREMRIKLPIDDIFVCYYRNSICYKPKPHLLYKAAKKYNLDLTKSFMVGDTEHDIGAGQNAGCYTVWIDHHYPNAIPPEPPATYTTYSLENAADWILEKKKSIE